MMFLELEKVLPMGWNFFVFVAVVCGCATPMGSGVGRVRFCPQVPVGHPRLSIVRRLRRQYLFVDNFIWTLAIKHSFFKIFATLGII